MGESQVTYEKRANSAWATINRPDSRNPLSSGVLRELRDAAEKAKVDEQVRALVLTGAGKVFSAGGDLSEMDNGTAPAEAHDGRGQLALLFRDLWELGKPTIARVQGAALAGGFGLALACDFLIASEDASFGTPEVKVGLWPYMITVPMVRSMPAKRALQLMLTGQTLSAAEGVEWGFVTECVPTQELDAAVHDLVGRVTTGSPTATKLGRDSFYAVWNEHVSTELHLLQAALTVTLGTAEAAEGLKAFSEKREPRWRS